MPFTVLSITSATLENPLKEDILGFTIRSEKLPSYWLITEIYRLNHYGKKDYRFYYLRTKDQAEIDLIIERPGKKLLIIEIKSTDRPDPIEAKKLERFLDDFSGTEAYLLCMADQAQKMGKVLCLPWKEGITRIFS